MKVLPMLFAALLLAISTLTYAAPEDKPFAEKKIVLQISDSDPGKQTLVLNVASNLIKHYGQDKIDVEIVAFGPGLRLLFDNNANKGRINGLSDTGVRFAACQNTIKKIKNKLGYEPTLHAKATPVPGGLFRIIDLVDEGYLLVKP